MNLINRTALRREILARCKTDRPGWRVSRIDPMVLDAFELKLRMLVGKAVRRHPTRGHTFTELLF